MQQPFLMKRDTVSGPARSDADKNIGQKRRTTNELRRIYGPGISHLQHHPLLFGAGGRLPKQKGFAFIINTDNNAAPYLNEEMGEDITALLEETLK